MYLGTTRILARWKGNLSLTSSIAFIEYEQERDADKALHAMESYMFGKRQLNVQVCAFPSNPQLAKEDKRPFPRREFDEPWDGGPGGQSKHHNFKPSYEYQPKRQEDFRPPWEREYRKHYENDNYRRTSYVKEPRDIQSWIHKADTSFDD